MARVSGFFKDGSRTRALPAPAVEQRQRYPVPDLARGLAVLFMILVHLTDYFARQEIYDDSVFGKVALFLGAAPAAVVFLVLMGYFIPAAKKTPKALILRGFVLFVGGIALNAGRSLHFLLRVWNGSSSIDPLDMIFCVDVLPFAGLSLMLLAPLIKLIAPNPIVYFILSLTAVEIGQYEPNTTELGPYAQHAMAFLFGRGYVWFPLFPWIAYPLLGIASFSLQKRWPVLFGENLRISIACAALAAIACFVILPDAASIITSQEQMLYFHPDLRMFAWCTCFTVGWFAALTIAQRGFGQTHAVQCIRWVGKQVTVIYAFQWLILWNLAPIFFKSEEVPSLLAWFAAVLIASSILALGWRISISRIRSPSPAAKLESALTLKSS